MRQGIIRIDIARAGLDLHHEARREQSRGRDENHDGRRPTRDVHRQGNAVTARQWPGVTVVVKDGELCLDTLDSYQRLLVQQAMREERRQRVIANVAERLEVFAAVATGRADVALALDHAARIVDAVLALSREEISAMENELTALRAAVREIKTVDEALRVVARVQLIINAAQAIELAALAKGDEVCKEMGLTYGVEDAIDEIPF